MSNTDKRLRTEDVYPGPRRSAIESLDLVIEGYEEAMNAAIDVQQWDKASEAQEWLKMYRAERATLFTCSIHEIEDGGKDGG